MNSGIYTITNTVNGKRYVGSSARLSFRLGQHVCDLRRNSHENGHLQHAWNKYREPAFRHDVLFYCDPNMLELFEQRTMNYLRPEYNIAPVAGSCLGIRRSDEFKAKIALATRGRKLSDATRERMRKPKPPGFAEKISQIMKGQKHTPEHTENHRQAMKARPRKTACLRGHPYAGEESDTYTRPDGSRVCRVCKRLLWRER